MEYLEKIKESFDPKLISALYSNFSDKYIALQELIDNSVDDRITGQILTVNISYIYDQDKLIINNVNGKGLGIPDLHTFFSWGGSKKTNRIGRYGQGGKAAIGYLGKGFIIKGHSHGKNDGFIVRVDNWQDREGGFKEFTPEPFSNFDTRGLVSIEILGLKYKFDTENIKEKIREIYRPLIADKKIDFIVNGEQVIPPKLHFDEGTVTRFSFDIDFLTKKYNLNGMYGIVSDKNSIRGGFSVYQFGRRIIKKEYFGQTDPSKRWNVERLYGELYLDFEIPLVMNKTDFQRGYLWEEIKKAMHDEIDATVKSAINYKEASKTEEKTVKAITTRIKRKEADEVEVGLCNYGPNLLFRVVDEGGKEQVQINRDHQAYQKWGMTHQGKILYSVMIYSLYKAVRSLSNKDAKTMLERFSESLKIETGNLL